MKTSNIKVRRTLTLGSWSLLLTLGLLTTSFSLVGSKADAKPNCDGDNDAPICTGEKRSPRPPTPRPTTGWVKVIAPDGSTVFDQPGLLNDALSTGWAVARGPACDQLKSAVNTGWQQQSGQSLYDINCSLAATGNLEVFQGIGNESNKIKLQYTLPGNYLEATTTQPTFLGKWADPRFSLSYNSVVTIILSIPNLSQGIQVESAVVQVQNAKLDSQNLVADIVGFFNNVIDFFTGYNFINRAQDTIIANQINLTQPLNNALAPVNNVLQQYTSQGYSLAQINVQNNVIQLSPDIDFSRFIKQPIFLPNLPELIKQYEHNLN